MPQGILSALGMLAVAILILFLAYWVTRMLGTWQMRSSAISPRVGGGGHVQLLSQLNLGKNERLVLIRIGDQCLLLGVTAERVTVLRELSTEEIEAVSAQPESGTSVGFTDILKDSLRKRK